MGKTLRTLALLGTGLIVGYAAHAIKNSGSLNDNTAVVYAIPTPDGNMQVGVQQITSFGHQSWERDVLLTKDTETKNSKKYTVSSKTPWRLWLDSDQCLTPEYPYKAQK